jgi:hypothetical protein
MDLEETLAEVRLLEDHIRHSFAEAADKRKELFNGLRTSHLETALYDFIARKQWGYSQQEYERMREDWPTPAPSPSFSFSSTDTQGTAPNDNNDTNNRRVCWHCRKIGHLRPRCPQRSTPANRLNHRRRVQQVKRTPPPIYRHHTQRRAF